LKKHAADSKYLFRLANARIIMKDQCETYFSFFPALEEEKFEISGN